MDEIKHLTAILKAAGISDKQIELSKKILELEEDTSRVKEIKINPVYDAKLFFKVVLTKDFSNIEDFRTYLTSKSLPNPLEYTGPKYASHDQKEYTEKDCFTVKSEHPQYTTYYLHLHNGDGEGTLCAAFFLDPEIRRDMEALMIQDCEGEGMSKDGED